MRELLLRGAPDIAYSIAPLTEMQRQGLRALYTFFRISRDTIDKAATKVESQISVQHLNRLFESSNIEDAIEQIPDLGLAWEAWLGLEEEFAVPRSYALEFARGLRMETENFRPETVEDLLRFCYQTGGVLGLVVCHIMRTPEAVMQAMVDAGSAARLTMLSRDIQKNFALGRNFVPLEWFTRAETLNMNSSWAPEAARRFEQLASVLYKSTREALDVLPYLQRVALSVAIVTHCESRGSWLRKLDRVMDEMLRQSGGALLNYTRLLFAKPGPGARTMQIKPQRALPTRDGALALRNQNLRLGRGL